MSLLPTAKTPPTTNMADLVTLIYGPPKIGKSTLASKFDGAVFLATEPGLNHLEVARADIGSWADFLAACNELATTAHGYKTVVIDTIDNLYMFAADHLSKLKGVEHVGDISGFGKGYALLNNEFRRVLTKLAMLPTGLIMISHAKLQDMEERTGKYAKAVPTVPGSARGIILGMADLILFCDVEVTKNEKGDTIERRVIRTKPTKFYEAGDRTGKLDAVLPLDYDELTKQLEG